MSEKYLKFIDTYGEDVIPFIEVWSGGVEGFCELIENVDDEKLKTLVNISSHSFTMTVSPPPSEYLNAYLDGKFSSKDFTILIKGIYDKWKMFDEDDVDLKNPIWRSVDEVLLFFLAYDKNMEKVIDELKDIDTEIDLSSYFEDEESIPIKKFTQLMKNPITPVLDMTKKEVKAIYGEPKWEKTDVMKTKTVDTWIYQGLSLKMFKDIEALEVKFENDKLTRFKDNRKNTRFFSKYKYRAYDEIEFIAKYNKVETYKLLIAIISNSKKISENHKKIIKEIKSALSGSLYAYYNFLVNQNNELDNMIKSGDRQQVGKKLALREMLEMKDKSIVSPLVNWGNFLSDKGDFPNAEELFLQENNLEDISNSAVIERMNSSKELSISGMISDINKITQTLRQKVQDNRCFIATATMGDHNHPLVVDLRIFRDDFLDRTRWGKSFINFYYTFGRYPAEIIKKSYFLRQLSFYLIIKPIHFLTFVFVKFYNKTKKIS